jgi:hypothetical protein
MSEPETKPEEIFDIHIDRAPYRVDHAKYTGLALRELAGLGPDVDLYLEQQGDVEDTLIRDDDVIDLKPGEHFYSTPRHITPGSCPRS